MFPFGKILSSICGVTIVAEILARGYGPRRAMIARSYHITYDDVFVWPLVAITKSHCTSYRQAKSQYDTDCQNDPTAPYKLISYPIVVEGLIFPKVLGLVNSDLKVHAENKS